MTNLTKITTAFGLLDEVYGPGTKAALVAHGGPYEMYVGASWRDCSRLELLQAIYRVKPAPPKPREWWISDDGKWLDVQEGQPIPDGWMYVLEATPKRLAADDLFIALRALHRAVCGVSGFAACVRRDSDNDAAYSWPALDAAEALADAALAKARGQS